MLLTVKERLQFLDHCLSVRQILGRAGKHPLKRLKVLTFDEVLEHLCVEGQGQDAGCPLLPRQETLILLSWYQVYEQG